MNRRQVLKRGVGVAVAGAIPLVWAQPVEITPVAISTPSATPAATIPVYEGPVSDLWDAPWKTEGFLVAFDGVILQRFLGEGSRGYAAGRDGLRFRSLLHLDVPDERGEERDLFVATNDDLAELDGRYTAHVEGTFAGKHDYQRGGGWTVPLIIAASIRPGAISG